VRTPWSAATRARLEAERTAQRTLAKLHREQELTARLRGELAELRGSYYLSGMRKKLDLRELDGFSQLAAQTIEDGRTGMSYDRLYTLWQAVAGAPDAPVIEIGSYRGGSARFIAEALRAHGRMPRLYVCDTFAGHADTDAEIDTSHHAAGKFEGTSAESVAAHLAGYPALELVVGDIARTSAGLPDQAYGLVHLDVDVYPTTAFCLRHFAPRLAPGALMVVDDYATRTCPGVKQAADEFVAERPQFRLWHLLSGQALLCRRAEDQTRAAGWRGAT
jgi:predicted O-methyltransferase YrrM